ncbi:MAG TPA: peptidylprolyl isomerase [Opitutaceae bacterium]
MISLRRFVSLAALLAGVQLALAQTQPVVTQNIPAKTIPSGTLSATVDLRAHFGLEGVSGTIVQFDTVLGKYNIELFDDTPLTRANFLTYVEAGQYNNTIIHRAPENFVIQGGGFTSSVPFGEVQRRGPVRNEFRRSNVRGTLAMAKVGPAAGQPPTDATINSATSQWFVNLSDNSENLDNQNGGFTVFARVLGNGMSTTINAIGALPRYSVDNVYADVPLRNILPNQQTLLVSNLVTIHTVRVIPMYPSGGNPSVLTFSTESSNPSVAIATVSGSTLTIVPGLMGTATITVRTVDTHNTAAQATFDVTVTAPAPGLVISAHPQSQHLPPGGSTTLSVTAQAQQGSISYQWLKDGELIAGATGASYNATSAGFYAARVTNGTTTLTSEYAIVTVATPGISRLINVSTRGSATGNEPLTPGFVLRGAGTKNLVVRAVGPGLGVFGVPGFIGDPTMVLNRPGQSAPILTNDDWGSGTSQQVAALTTASAAVGAFALPAGSKDAAALAALQVSGSTDYTVNISPSGSTAGGVALAEVYDADGLSSPTRLVNVSTLGSVTADGLTPGFVIGGTAAKQLLIRVVAPTLADAPFNVPGTLADPTLKIYPLGKDFSIAANDNWSDSNRAALEAAFAASGAFVLPAGSKDAAVLVRLPPGGYTAVATGVGGTTGRALVEVYDLDP